MNSPEIASFKYPEWTPPPEAGFVGVVGKVILDSPDLILALLRFDMHATIPPHPGESDTLVACLEGAGYTSVGGVTAPIAAGQRVTWPAGIVHGLWTQHSTMTTLMVERPGSVGV